MKAYDSGSIRNVAVVGHGGAGKTQLIAALLYTAGATPRLGRVDDGTTVTDYDDEEIARKHTLSASLAWAEWNKTKINFIDTPGMGNFLSDARAGLRVADAALVVVDAVSGVEVQTEKVWAEADALGLPRLVVVNRLDRERSSLDRTLASVREALSRTIIPVQLPIGEERGFSGVIDLVGMKAWTYASDGSGKATEGPVPFELSEVAGTAREQLIEMVAEADDALMERFFEAGTLTQDELLDGLRKAVLSGKVAPLLCASGLAAIGTSALLDALVGYVPSPVDRPFTATDSKSKAEVTHTPDAAGPYTAFVWKTVADPFAGRITLFRIMTGTLKADTQRAQPHARHQRADRAPHRDAGQDADQRARAEGRRHRRRRQVEGHADQRHAGGEGRAGDPAHQFPRTRAVVRDRAQDARRRGQDQHRDAPAGGRGPDHPVRARPADQGTAAVGPGPAAHRGDRRQAQAAIRRRGEPQAAPHPVSRDHHRAGRGARPPQEADGRPRAVRRLQDPDGADGARQRLRVRRRHLRRLHSAPVRAAVEKGIQDSRMRGYLAGYPVVDFKVTVFDGSYHQVDSNEMSFKMAGSLAFKDGMSRARPTILEPVMTVEIYAPSDYAGDLMGDLNGRRGRISGMDTRGATTVIRAQVPMAEMLTYEQQLTSATGGRGSYHMEYSHYEEVPSHQQQKIIAAAKAERAGVEVEEV